MTHCNDRYVELEVQAENNSEDPVYGPLHAPSELGRAPGLEADLEYDCRLLPPSALISYTYTNMWVCACLIC